MDALLILLTVAVGLFAIAADADFGEYVRSRGGSPTSAPGFSETYRQMAAGGRLLQCGLVGGCGLVLFWVGCLGLNRRGTEVRD